MTLTKHSASIELHLLHSQSLHMLWLVFCDVSFVWNELVYFITIERPEKEAIYIRYISSCRSAQAVELCPGRFRMVCSAADEAEAQRRAEPLLAVTSHRYLTITRQATYGTKVWPAQPLGLNFWFPLTPGWAWTIISVCKHTRMGRKWDFLWKYLILLSHVQICFGFIGLINSCLRAIV